MPDLVTSETIEDRANGLIRELARFKESFDQTNFNIFAYHNLVDEASTVKKELIEKIYLLSDLISKGTEFNDAAANLLMETSASKGAALIQTVKIKQQRIQDERVCRRIGLVILHANITNSISDIESRLYQQLTVIDQMESRALASPC